MEYLLSIDPKLRFVPVVMDLFFEVHFFLKISELYDDGYTTCFENKGRDLLVKLFCVDPSGQMREALKRARSSVFFSATLAPLEYFSQILGCSESIQKRVLPSPFPSENLRLLVMNSISTFYRDRGKTVESLVQAIGSLVSAKKGNYLVFFPSYKYMDLVFPLYAQTFLDHRLLLQTPGMKEQDREYFLQNFSEEENGILVGFVVMGGIFGEGIDLVGDCLSGAVIVGVGLPGLSPERDLIRIHFSEQDQDGFNFAYLFPGINRVFQAAGRVIRTEEDRGAILLIDRRYSRETYRSLLLDHWEVRFVQEKDQVERDLEEFWD
jgi:DNA excision repair protein ERCC-2